MRTQPASTLRNQFSWTPLHYQPQLNRNEAVDNAMFSYVTFTCSTRVYWDTNLLTTWKRWPIVGCWVPSKNLSNRFLYIALMLPQLDRIDGPFSAFIMVYRQSCKVDWNQNFNALWISKKNLSMVHHALLRKRELEILMAYIRKIECRGSNRGSKNWVQWWRWCSYWWFNIEQYSNRV